MPLAMSFSPVLLSDCLFLVNGNIFWVYCEILQMEHTQKVCVASAQWPLQQFISCNMVVEVDPGSQGASIRTVSKFWLKHKMALFNQHWQKCFLEKAYNELKAQ